MAIVPVQTKNSRTQQVVVDMFCPRCDTYTLIYIEIGHDDYVDLQCEQCKGQRIARNLMSLEIGLQLKEFIMDM